MKTLLAGTRLIALASIVAVAWAGVANATTHTFTVMLDGSKEVPPVTPAGTGTATVTLDDVTGMVTVSGTYTGMTSTVMLAHIHGSSLCMNAGILVTLSHTGGTAGTFSGGGTFTAGQVTNMLNGLMYLNVHTANNGGGEIRARVLNGDWYCNSCDGAPALCPCANPGNADAGCNNAQATGGVRLQAPVWSPDGLGGGTATLTGTGFPGTASPTAIIIRSPTQAGPSTFGDGLLCIGATTRLAATTASAGTSTHNINHGAGAGLFHYQVWYRNNPVTFCDSVAGFNTSNGLKLVW